VTRIVWCRQDGERSESSNEGTLCLGAAAAPFASPPSRATFQELFRAHYPAIHGLLDGRAEPGLALLATGEDGAEACGFFPARDHAPNPVILGRHGCADVFLPSDPRVSLRHLALVVLPQRGRDAVAFRVLDLRTPLAFADEAGSRLEAVEASGPVLLWLGSVGVFLFPTGLGEAGWPEDAEEAWARVPPRRFLEKAAAPAHRAPAAIRSLGEPATATATLVHTFPGPGFASLPQGDPEPPRGELLVASDRGRVAVSVGDRAARRGVLLGRYERCDTAGLAVLDDPALSRAHLLILEIDGALHAVDASSKNGTWAGGERIRTCRLAPGTRLALAGKATVEWRAFH
jgi:hypothetical protein